MDYHEYLQKASILNDEFTKLYEKLYKKTSLKDGIYNPTDYFTKDRVKVCVVLKEINRRDDDDKWEPVSVIDNRFSIYGDKNNPPATAIVRAFKETLLDKKQLIEGSWTDTISGIAYVNLSKIPGGSKSNDTSLAAIVNGTWNLLMKQLSLLDADIYVFGGTFKYLWPYFADDKVWPHLLKSTKGEDINDTNHNRLSFYKYRVTDKDRLFVQTYHPSRHLPLWTDLGVKILEVFQKFEEGSLIDYSEW